MKLAPLTATLAAALIALPALPAQATNEVSYVRSTGSGTACTRAAPCGDLQSAHDATSADGAINCLDSGPFSSLVIGKSITIDCSNAVLLGVVISTNDVVVSLRNLFIDGRFTDNAIRLVAGAELLVENCFIMGTTNFSSATGIAFNPSTPSAQLTVRNTVITGNGAGSTGGGIVVKPQAGGSARVFLDRVTIAKNIFGIAADGTGSTGGINMTIADSISTGNAQDGIIAVTPSGGAPIGITVKNSRSLNNNIGIRSIGTNVTVRVDGSTVVGNNTGLSFSGSGLLLSAGNNTVEANGADGTFSGSLALK